MPSFEMISEMVSVVYISPLSNDMPAKKSAFAGGAIVRVWAVCIQ